MTRNEFTRRFPNASQSTIERNCEAVAGVPAAEPERTQANALDSAISGETKSIQRPTVRIVFCRQRALDKDNYSGSGKDILDGLRHAGLVSGDSEAEIELVVEQVKVEHRIEQGTIVEITYP